MKIIILIAVSQEDQRSAHSNSRARQGRATGGELLATHRQRHADLPSGRADDPLFESWQKLLAKYRRK